MGRKKAKNQEALLTRRLILRVNDRTLKRLKTMAKETDCRTVGELARRILSNERITVFHRDTSLEAPVQELIRIRRELRAIGVNVNQITHFFHASDTANQKMFHALKVAEEYGKVGDKVEVLIEMVTGLGKKWLQR